jgi:hypothetical protein
LQYRVTPEGQDDEAAAPGRAQREKLMGFARSVEAWMLGGVGVLVLAACLQGKNERAHPASRAGVVPEVELVQPQAGEQPMYVVYVVGKRPSAAEKRAAQPGKG